jgi:hypothetical protein
VTTKTSVIKKIDRAILDLKNIQSALPFYMRLSQQEMCEYERIDQIINELKECLVLLEKTEI